MRFGQGCRCKLRFAQGDGLNYYPFNLGDYAAHTGHLEPMEDLAYRRLLDQYYMREGPLPVDINATAKLVRMRSCMADVEAVLNEFFTLTEEGWRHRRCDEEIERMQDKQAKARASAAASVNARRAKAPQTSGTTVERSLPEVQTPVERSLPLSVTNVELPTPTPTPIPNKGVQGGKPPNPPLELPSWLPKTEWGEFVAMRKAKGKRAPFTDAAARGVIDAVGRLRDVGNDPAAVLRQSVVNGWSGVFELKGPATAGNGRRQQTVDWTEQAL